MRGVGLAAEEILGMAPAKREVEESREVEECELWV